MRLRVVDLETSGGDRTAEILEVGIVDVVRDGEVVAKLRVSSVEAGRAAAEIVPDSLAQDTVLMVGDRVVPSADAAK
jgi:DNA polymerase III epsilon subunit-like protein